MRGRIKIIILILLLYANVKGQTYIPFPDSNAVWKVEHRDIPMHCPPFGYCFTVRYSYDGDSLINGINYKKISECPNMASCYRGALRQDKPNKKVYFIETGSNQENVLYDFSLSIGDTLPNNTLNPVDKCIIVSTDSILMGNKYHKTFNINCPMSVLQNLTLIEGVGSNFGMLESFLVFEHFSKLICFSEDSGLIYSDTTQYSNCIDMTNLVYNINSTTKTYVFPNPLQYSNIMNIYSSKRIICAKMYNEFGELIFSRNYSSWNEQEAIESTQFYKGVFVLKLELESGLMQYEKIIIY